MSKYLGRNINIFLIIIIIITVMILAVLSTYYTARYQGASREVNNISTSLKQTQKTLIETQSELATIQASYNQTTQDVAKYDQIYTEKVTQLDKTTDELEDMTAEYKRTKADLQEKTSLLKTEQDRNSRLSAQVLELQGELAVTKTRLTTCNNELNSCEDKLPQ